jgi:transcriptional regulator with XRE-family HTH domain
MGTSLDILALRTALNWSQAQMAEYLGLDRSSVSRMERGQQPTGATRKLLEQLATKTQDEAAA